jgi:hypothetical protein
MIPTAEDYRKCVKCLKVIPEDAVLNRSGIEYGDDKGNVQYGTYFLCPFRNHPISLPLTIVVARYAFNMGAG